MKLLLLKVIVHSSYLVYFIPILNLLDLQNSLRNIEYNGVNRLNGRKGKRESKHERYKSFVFAMPIRLFALANKVNNIEVKKGFPHRSKAVNYNMIGPITMDSPMA